MNSKRRQLFSQVADVVFTNTEELEKKEAVQRLAAVLEGQLQK